MSQKLLIFTVGILTFVVLGLFFVYMLKTETPKTPDREGGILSFFPFGQGSVPTPITTGNENAPIENEGQQNLRTITQLQQLTSFPVAGYFPMQDKGGYSVRYVERSTGHVFDIAVDTPTAPIRVSNTTAPKNFEALWQPSGTSLLLRSLDADNESIISFAGNLRPVASSTENQLSGIFLPRNIFTAAIPPGGGKIVYLETLNDGSHIVIANPDGSKKTEVFVSPLTEWDIDWPATSTITVVSKPSAFANGILYFLNTSAQQLSLVLDSIRGLTALTNQNLTKVLFSETKTRGLSTSVLDVKSKNIAELPIETLPEKCVWSKKKSTIVYCGVPLSLPPAIYPDMWYQGVVSFSDALWRIDIQSRSAELVSLVSDEAKKSIDVIKPKLSADENYLYFVNKNDSTLWSLKLTIDNTQPTTTPSQ
ncbi:hypothetical protein A2671_01635 [Candidatus Kaiserbacteria bacterium RIFCSPHIGHO2_01_FULL_49_13]|uniref:DUF5050 domain-containing protein n=1 Tax=Candidatus Kaiserbacteria bacterium RIFCSPHIGHO2_01_FULL_49_13 TaxID=1798477 RepID=A0A1F6CFN5_9BACT|nr:MAG: hypothetical protein A2671_01635 [Candidatus Kaiserbacteria bacterium RIFCSPHIGHO2_01_FULL_49_13]